MQSLNLVSELHYNPGRKNGLCATYTGTAPEGVTVRISSGCFLFLFASTSLLAQFAEDASPPRGVRFFEHILGSGSSLGLVTKFETAVGYQFNRYFAVDGGIPLYLVSASSTAQSSLGTSGSHSGIGNAYVDLRFSLANPTVNYSSSLMLGVPTGDKNRGLGTGSATYDWTNLFDHSFGRLTPFASLGVANTITDAPFFVRPFTSLGFLSHFEGGATYKIARRVSAGASAYAITPSGQQKIFSKIFGEASGGSGAPAPGRGRHGHQGVFETASQSIGGADIARDHGFSAWLAFSLAKSVDVEAGYSRSFEYALDSVFFGLNFNLRSLIMGR